MEQPTSLSAERQRLLALRLKRPAGAPAAAAARIPKRPAGPRAPLSVGQHQMWIIDQINPGNPAYNLAVAYRLTGTLAVDVLEESINRIIQRHEVWRTTFHEVQGDGVQEIHPECRVTISVIPLDHLASEARPAEASARCAEEAIKPFDLCRLPLLRAFLYRLEAGDHVLLLNLHHIVGDGLSLNVMFDELDAVYRAVSSGTAPQLPELPVQYADFSVWQQEDLARDPKASQLAYWQQQLAGELPVLELATELPRPPRQSFRGASLDFYVPVSVVQPLTALAKSENCTFFIAILAAFQVILLRDGKGEEVVIGSPVANRLPETDRLIGNFLNIVALRGDLSGQPTYLELLRRGRKVTLDALSNKDLPFEKVVAGLRLRREPARNPVFQALMQILPMVRARVGELSVSRFAFEARYAQVDVALLLYEQPDGGFLGQIHYGSDLFTRAKIEGLAEDFLRLLREVIAAPERSVLSAREAG